MEQESGSTVADRFWKWETLDKETGALRGHFDGSENSRIEELRYAELSFYKRHKLVEARYADGQRAYALYAKAERPGEESLLPINGESTVVYEANKANELQFSGNEDPKINDYLRFFCWALQSEQGQFLLPRNADDPPLKGKLPVEAQKLDWGIFPVDAAEAERKGYTDEQRRQPMRKALVAYGTAVFRAWFAIDQEFQVSMVDDEPVAEFDLAPRQFIRFPPYFLLDQQRAKEEEVIIQKRQIEQFKREREHANARIDELFTLLKGAEVEFDRLLCELREESVRASSSSATSSAICEVDGNSIRLAHEQLLSYFDEMIDIGDKEATLGESGSGIKQKILQQYHEFVEARDISRQSSWSDLWRKRDLWRARQKALTAGIVALNRGLDPHDSDVIALVRGKYVLGLDSTPIILRGLNCNKHLDLSETYFERQLVIRDARIEGGLDFPRCVFEQGLNAEDAEIAGSLSLREVRAPSSRIELSGATIAGQLNALGLVCSEVNATGIHIGRSLNLAHSAMSTLGMDSGEIGGYVFLRGATIDDIALQSIAVRCNVFFGGCQSKNVSLQSAELKGGVEFGELRDMNRTHFLRKFDTEGGLNLYGASVNRDLDLSNAKVGALHASSMTVKGNVNASALESAGDVDMPFAKLSGNVDFCDARIKGVLRIDHCAIKRLECNDIEVGALFANAARIENDVRLRGLTTLPLPDDSEHKQDEENVDFSLSEIGGLLRVDRSGKTHSRIGGNLLLPGSRVLGKILLGGLEVGKMPKIAQLANGEEGRSDTADGRQSPGIGREVGIVDLSDREVFRNIDWRLGGYCHRLDMRKVKCHGDVNLSGVRIGEHLFDTLGGIEAEKLEGVSCLNLSGASISGKLFLKRTEPVSGEPGSTPHDDRDEHIVWGSLDMSGAEIGHFVVHGDAFASKKHETPNENSTSVNLSDATIGHLEMHKPIPRGLDLTQLTVRRWSEGGENSELDFIDVLRRTSTFRRSIYTSIESYLINSGNGDRADAVRREMFEQVRKRESRKLRSIWLWLHSRVGYGTSYQRLTGILLAWLVSTIGLFTYLWEDKRAFTLDPELEGTIAALTEGRDLSLQHTVERRLALPPSELPPAEIDSAGEGEVAPVTPPSDSAGGIVSSTQSLTSPSNSTADSTSTGEEDAESARMEPTSAMSPDSPVSLKASESESVRLWLRRVALSIGKALHYHVPILGVDLVPEVQPTGWLRTYAMLVAIIHWILWPLILASLLPKLVPRREAS